MRITIKHLAVAVLVLMPSAYAFCANAQAIDITPVFSGTEKNCGRENNQIKTVMTWLRPSDNGKLMPASAAPGMLQPAIVGTSVKDQGDSWLALATLKGAVYRGIPVSRIERWSGKDNGISGYSLIFADGKNVVNKKLKMAKFNPSSEEAMPQLTETDKPITAALVCDFSN
jgi:hypothetical protein